MKKLMAELVSKLFKIDTTLTKVFEFSKIKIDLTKYNVSYVYEGTVYFQIWGAFWVLGVAYN